MGLDYPFLGFLQTSAQSISIFFFHLESFGQYLQPLVFSARGICQVPLSCPAGPGRSKGQIPEEEEAHGGRHEGKAKQLQHLPVPVPSLTQPSQQYSVFPASCAGQVVMVFCLLVQWDWKKKNPEELVSLQMERFKNWRRVGLPILQFQLEFELASGRLP